MGDVIHDGIALIISEVIIIITYVVISGPAAVMISSIAAAGASIPQMAALESEVNTVLDICFVIAAFSPIIWFAVRMMSREPDWGVN